MISLSGVMAPGAMTAATIAEGTRNRWAGVLISIGHAAVEIPLIVVLILGLHFVFQWPAVQIAIGLFGGGFLIWMATGMFRQIRQIPAAQHPPPRTGAITTGIVLSAGNPYFLLWWATVGLNLALGAKELGVIALVLFAVVHWMCDLIWLSFLSFSAFYTSKHVGLFSGYIEKAILIFGSSALVIFGLKFIYDSLDLWLF